MPESSPNAASAKLQDGAKPADSAATAVSLDREGIRGLVGFPEDRRKPQRVLLIESPQDKLLAHQLDLAVPLAAAAIHRERRVEQFAEQLTKLVSDQ